MRNDRHALEVGFGCDNNVQRFQLENPDREKSGVGQRQWVRKVYSSSFIAEVL